MKKNNHFTLTELFMNIICKIYNQSTAAALRKREGFGGEKAARSVASLPVPLELRHTPGCDIPARIRTGSAPAKGSGNAMGSFRKKAGRPLVFPRLSFPPARACR